MGGDSESEETFRPRANGKRNYRRLWLLGWIVWATSHLSFFLPVRALLPISPTSDPAWGTTLAGADSLFCILLLWIGAKKVRSKLQQGGEKLR
jgi:hypothetical protein